MKDKIVIFGAGGSGRKQYEQMTSGGGYMTTR